MRSYYLGPPVWYEPKGRFPYWGAPEGFSLIDLRSLPQQAMRGGNSGLCLFYGDGEIKDSNYDKIGDGSFYEIKPSRKFLDALPARRGYAVKGPDLVGILLDYFTEGADPLGQDGPLPLMPVVGGRLELCCGGQQHFDTFRAGIHPHWPKVQDCLKRQFAEQFAAAQRGELKDSQQHLRILDATAEKYGLRSGQDWKALVPLELVTEVPGLIQHETTITENFNTADSGTLGPQLTWSELIGDQRIESNKARGGSANSADAMAQAVSDLSSTDMYVQCETQISLSELDNAPAARCQSGPTAYLAIADQSGSNNRIKLYKWVSGSYTQLGSNVNVTWANGDTLKCEANGSSISAYRNGSSQIGPITDTAISSGVRAGIWCYGVSVGYLDNFEAADLSAGGGIKYTQLERNVRGMARGMWGGGL